MTQDMDTLSHSVVLDLMFIDTLLVPEFLQIASKKLAH